VDQFLLGAQQTDFVFFQLCLLSDLCEVRVIDAGLDLIEQLAEIGLCAGDGNPVLLDCSSSAKFGQIARPCATLTDSVNQLGKVVRISSILKPRHAQEKSNPQPSDP